MNKTQEDYLAKLKSALDTARFKRKTAAEMGWYQNIDFWNEEEGRLEKQIAELSKTAE